MRILVWLAAALLGLAPAQAQQYPDRVIKMVVPFVPGSPVDVLARVVSQQMTVRLGQSVVIENRPGAGTSAATKQVQASPPDGYTLLMSGQNITYVGLLYPDIGFDPVKSFTPVATLAGWSHVLLVANTVPAKSLKELVAYAKANPGKVTFGYGLGTSPQIVGKSFELAAKLDLINVPYKGGEQVRVDLLGGRIHINFAPVSNALPMIQEGKVRALAVTSSARDPSCRACRPSRRRAFRMSASIPTSGRRSSRRSARRRRSSTSSTPRSMRHCALTRCRRPSRSCASNR
jgi:tripartite-type tricarboxylate transporter receptor subunit TctC